MVCCEAYPNLQMWQHAELVTDCKSPGQGLFHSLDCPIPTCGHRCRAGQEGHKAADGEVRELRS
jgi:hypothetical protein